MMRTSCEEVLIIKHDDAVWRMSLYRFLGVLVAVDFGLWRECDLIDLTLFSPRV